MRTESEFVWSNEAMPHNKNADQVFAEVCGPKRLPESVKEPIDYFLLFFKMQLVSFIVEQTNLYYQQQVSASQCPLKPFPDVCEEILSFFGMIIAMGLYKLPKISDYWQTRGIGVMPWFRSVFSKNRFFAINRCLHLNDNTKRPEQGHTGYKLFHVQPVIDSILQTFQSMYTPAQDLSVD